MHRRARAWALGVGLMGAVAACGGGSDDSDAAPQGDAGAGGSSAAGAAGAAGSTAGAGGSSAGASGAGGSSAGASGAGGSSAGAAGAGGSSAGAAGAGGSSAGAAGAGGASTDPCSAPIVGSCDQTTGTHTCVASHHGDAMTIKAGCDASKGTFSTSGCPSGSVGHCVLNDANGAAFQSNYYYVPNAQYPSACAAAKGTWCPP